MLKIYIKEQQINNTRSRGAVIGDSVQSNMNIKNKNAIYKTKNDKL